MESQTNSKDREIKKLASTIAAICLGNEFKTLKTELVEIYTENNVEKPELCAFEDALYSLLSQQEDVELCKIKVF